VFYLLECVSAHEDMNIGCKCGLSTLHTAPLSVDYLLHPVAQILFPCTCRVLGRVCRDQVINRVDTENKSTKVWRSWAHRTNLQFVLSLKFPSSSSDAWRLWFLEFVLEFATDEVLEDIRDCAFFETVFPLSRACRLRSCILATLNVFLLEVQ